MIMKPHQIHHLNRLVENSLPNLTLDENHIVPDYYGYSIANIPSSICEWLGAPGIGQKTLALPGKFVEKRTFKQVILLLIDALSLDSLLAAQQLPVWGSFLKENNLAALTSVVPSTTTSALVSLWTGCTPFEHGITGYEMYLKEYGLIANMISFAPSSFPGEVNILRKAGFQPENFLAIPSLSQHLKYHHIDVHAFQPANIARSSLTTMLTPGAIIHPYRTQSDLWISIEQLVTKRSENPRYIWAYWGDYDDLGHQFDPYDSRLLRELEHLGQHIQQFISALTPSVRSDTLFLLTADHGMIATPTDEWYELRNHHKVWDKLILPPSGENRFAYLYPYTQTASLLNDMIRETWGDEFILVKSQAASQAGLFGQGNPHPAFADRIGEYILIARKDAYIWWAQKENTLKGRHGGLSREEMLVPLLSVPMD
jgi:hypothetical protein